MAAINNYATSTMTAPIIHNTTPHAIVLYAQDRQTVLVTWEPSAIQCRVQSTSQEVAHPTGLPVVTHQWSSADEQLPAPQEGVFYMVSTLFADRIRVRTKADLLIPDSGPTAVREGNQILGVVRFTAPT